MGIKASARRLVRRIHFGMKGEGWRDLRSVGNSRLVKSSYVWLVAVPAVAKLLQPIAAKYTVPAWLHASTPEVSLGLPFSWGLFYVMALFFALGQLVYTFGCPRIVKHFANFGEFRSAHIGAWRLLNYLLDTLFRTTPEESTSMVQTIALSLRFGAAETAKLQELGHVVAKGSTRASVYQMVGQLLRCVVERHDSEVYLGELFDIVYGEASGQRTVLRWIAAACFIVGFAILLVIVGQNSYAVWKIW